MVIKNILKFAKNTWVSKSLENLYDPFSEFFLSKTEVEKIPKLQTGQRYNTFPYSVYSTPLVTPVYVQRKSSIPCQVRVLAEVCTASSRAH